MPASRESQSTNVLGVKVSGINIPLALDTIDTWIRERNQHYICVTGVHGIMESLQDDALRHIHNRAGLVTPDGMPLVWLSRLNGLQHVSRVYGPDLMLALCEHSLTQNYRHFLYGGADGVPERLADALVARYPALNIVGTYSPPFRAVTEQEDAAIVDMINATQPDIVWVGLSTPKQERWMAEHVGRVSAPVLIGVGAAFDFHAGLKKQAPLWMQRSGLEWFFRLSTEPRRLWKRYLINNPKFVYNILLQLTGMKKYPIAEYRQV